MQVDRIKVSLEGYGIWGGMEASISPEENPIDEWIKLKEMVQLAMGQADQMKGTLVEPVEEQQKKTPEEQKAAAIDSQIEAISGCTSRKSLEIFKKLVDREAIPRLTEAYFKRYQQLTEQF